MGAAEDAVRPFRNLAAAINRLTEPLGLELAGLALLPTGDGPARLQMIWIVDEEQLTRPPDQDQIDEQFEALVDADRKQTREERLETARRELLDLGRSLANPDEGIGLEDR